MISSPLRGLSNEKGPLTNPKRPSLETRGHLHNFLPDCTVYKLSLVMNVELSHKVEFVRLNCLDAQVEHAGNFADSVALSEQFHDLSFARGKG